MLFTCLHRLAACTLGVACQLRWVGCTSLHHMTSVRMTARPYICLYACMSLCMSVSSSLIPSVCSSVHSCERASVRPLVGSFLLCPSLLQSLSHSARNSFPMLSLCNSFCLSNYSSVRQIVGMSVLRVVRCSVRDGSFAYSSLCPSLCPSVSLSTRLPVEAGRKHPAIQSDEEYGRWLMAYRPSSDPSCVQHETLVYARLFVDGGRGVHIHHRSFIVGQYLTGCLFIRPKYITFLNRLVWFYIRASFVPNSNTKFVQTPV